MTYAEIYDRAEAVLLAMVAEGRAELAHQGPSGAVFRAEEHETLARMEAAGLMADGVPWPYTVKAWMELTP